MCLKPLRRLTRKTSFRLTLWYSSIFILSAVILFTITYLLLSQSIRERDRRVAVAKINQYSRTAEQKGLPTLIEQLEQEKAANEQAGIFVRLSDAKNQTLFLTFPQGWADVNPDDIEKTTLFGARQWVIWQMDHGEGVYEMTRFTLSKDVSLQVGFGVAERERLLAYFRKIFIMIMIPVVLVGVVGGFFVAHRALGPVKDLIEAIHSIDTGQLDARVPSRYPGDELDELVRLFNGMLTKIERLVNGMREALSNVAHDLRTPVTRLRVGVETMLQSESDVEALREALMDCAEESERIVTILNTLFDISEAETGTLRLNIQPVDIAALIREAVELYQYVAEDKELDISVTMPEALPARADADRIRQVIANLLDNAIKYTPPGGWISIEADRLGQEMEIRIKDNGTGIPAEDLPRIFERLYRGDKSRTHRGLGLGLSLVQAVLNAHQGRVEVQSQPGRGSTFIFFLPVSPKANL